MKRLSAAFLCLTFVALNQSFSQSTQDLVNKMMPKPVPTSPNVSALGKYGDYEVSHFTGLPEISIPIYEVTSGNLVIPITLSYHASGIKPTDVASWVGAGWSLSTGGQISRSLNGRADEAVGNGYSYSALNPSPSLCESFGYLHNAANGITDLEPDIFSYSFPGHTGKFMWTYNGPYLFPYAPIKLSATSGLDVFEIIDERGFISRFGQNGNVENSTTASGPNLPTGARSAWLLTEMLDSNSDDYITLDYQSLGTFSTHDISYSFSVTDQCVASNGASCPPETVPQPQMYNVNSSGDQRAPSSINFATGKVNFFLSSGFRADANLKYLDRIEIQSMEGTILKTVKFVYSYFTSPDAANAALKLDAVQIKDSGGAIIQKYRFDYFTNTVSWRPANDADLRARDLWGYYNGATGNSDLLLPKTIPYQPNVGSPTTISFGGGTDRGVNPAYVKEGVLKRIYFPTGGSTEFDFESNKYLNGATATLAGGLRVTKILTRDGTSAPPITKTYKYGEAESGYGFPNFWEFQFNYNNSQFSHDRGCDWPYPTVDLRIRVYQSSVAYSYETNPVMYTHVTEFSGDHTGTINGKIAYVFDDGIAIDDVNYFVAASGKFFRNSLAWKRGRLTSKTVFDKYGNKLSETTIGYTLHKDESRHVGHGVHQYYPIIQTLCCCVPGTCTTEAGIDVYLNSMFWTAYYQNSGSRLESSRVQKDFESGDIGKFVSTTTSQTYHADKLQPVQISKTQSAETIVTVSKYPFELAANASSTGAAEGIYLLNQKNVLTSPIETYSYLIKSGGDVLISSQLTTYRKNGSNSNQVVPDQLYLWEGSIPLAKSSYVPVTINGTNSDVSIDPNLKTRITFTNYDEKGNITSALKSNEVPVSYSYGYKNLLPVAEVKNALNTQYVVNTATESITIAGPTSGTIQASYPITVDYVGPVILKLGVNANPTYSTVATYSGILSGSTTIGKNGCGVSIITFPNVAPGNYTITITLTTPDAGVSSLGVCGDLIYPDNSSSTTGTTEFLFESFEENSSTSVKSGPLLPHSGSKYYEGDFTVTFTKPNTRDYVVEYFYFDTATSKWEFISKAYAGPSMILSEGTAIDHVRIRPADALMTTYTYDFALRLSAITDQNNVTWYYNYDDFGRLKLVKDDAGNIITTYDYHYKQ